MRNDLTPGRLRRWMASALLFLLIPVPAPGQGEEVHGENSIFLGQGVAIAWGVGFFLGKKASE